MIPQVSTAYTLEIIIRNHHPTQIFFRYLRTLEPFLRSLYTTLHFIRRLTRPLIHPSTIPFNRTPRAPRTIAVVKPRQASLTLSLSLLCRTWLGRIRSLIDSSAEASRVAAKGIALLLSRCCGRRWGLLSGGWGWRVLDFNGWIEMRGRKWLRGCQRQF